MFAQIRGAFYFSLVSNTSTMCIGLYCVVGWLLLSHCMLALYHSSKRVSIMCLTVWTQRFIEQTFIDIAIMLVLEHVCRQFIAIFRLLPKVDAIENCAKWRESRERMGMRQETSSIFVLDWNVSWIGRRSF